MLRKWGLCLFSLLAGIILAILGSTPPGSVGADAPASEFSSARAMKDVRIIAAKPHPTGSAENAKVRDYISAQLRNLGMEVSIDAAKLDALSLSLSHLNRWSGQTLTEQPIYNIIGVIPGKDRSQKALLLMAHYDTVWGSPGAADDTVGVASILEIVRALNASGDAYARDLIILMTDAEEIGLVGARHFFESHPLKDKIGAVVNLEARGGGGTANMFQTSHENGEAARLYARAVRQPTASSLSIFVYNILPNDTDLTPALAKDYAAFNIANIGRPEYYHSPATTPDTLSENMLQHMGSQGLDLTRALLAAENLPAKKPDATFFDVFGFFTVIYAPAWGWLFLALAGLFYILSVKGNFQVKSLLRGSGKMLGFIILGGAALYALNALSNSPGDNYYDRLAAIGKLEVLAASFALAAFLAVFGAGKIGPSQRAGIALPLFIAGIAGQVLAPTAAYFIPLALLLCAAGSWIIEPATVSGKAQSLVKIIIAGTFIALTLGYMGALGHLLTLGVGPDMLSADILPAAIAAMALSISFPGISNRPRYAVCLVALALSIAIALFIKLDPMASTIPVYY